MAEQTDRWVSRILDLPVFDVEFARSVKKTPLNSLAFVTALEATSGTQFAQKVFDLAGSFEESVSKVFQGRELMLEQFWTLSISVEKAYFESTAVQLGFGLCEKSSSTPSVDPSASLKKRAAIAYLTAKPFAQPKRSKATVESSSSSSTPLLDKEKSEKKRWAVRLEAIGERAGHHARLFEDAQLGPNLSQGEKMQLRNLVPVSGAHRTMAGHVKTFERLERWFGALDVPLYPLTMDKILKYCLFLNDRFCGPSVLPTLRAAVKWVCARLAIDSPDFEAHQFQALQASVMSDRAKTLKEAIPFPLEVVGEVEEFVVSRANPEAARLFMWWVLCLIFASLRFDDGIHVKPRELHLADKGLFGVAWQTKVERKKVGTRSESRVPRRLMVQNSLGSFSIPP